MGEVVLTEQGSDDYKVVEYNEMNPEEEDDAINTFNAAEPKINNLKQNHENIQKVTASFPSQKSTEVFPVQFHTQVFQYLIALFLHFINCIIFNICQTIKSCDIAKYNYLFCKIYQCY